MLSVMHSGSNCSSSPFAVVARQTVPTVELTTPYGIARGSIEFSLDESAISLGGLSLAMTEAFGSYFDMDISDGTLSGIFFHSDLAGRAAYCFRYTACISPIG